MLGKIVVHKTDWISTEGYADSQQEAEAMREWCKANFTRDFYLQTLPACWEDPAANIRFGYQVIVHGVPDDIILAKLKLRVLP